MGNLQKTYTECVQIDRIQKVPHPPASTVTRKRTLCS